MRWSACGCFILLPTVSGKAPAFVQLPLKKSLPSSSPPTPTSKIALSRTSCLTSGPAASGLGCSVSCLAFLSVCASRLYHKNMSARRSSKSRSVMARSDIVRGCAHDGNASRNDNGTEMIDFAVDLIPVVGPVKALTEATTVQETGFALAELAFDVATFGAGSAAKGAVKGVTKAAVKGAAKSATKAAVKGAVKGAAKSATKAAVKGAVKGAAKGTAKAAVKGTAKAATKGAVKGAVNAVAKEIVKDTARVAAKGATTASKTAAKAGRAAEKAAMKATEAAARVSQVTARGARANTKMAAKVPQSLKHEKAAASISRRIENHIAKATAGADHLRKQSLKLGSKAVLTKKESRVAQEAAKAANERLKKMDAIFEARGILQDVKDASECLDLFTKKFDPQKRKYPQTDKSEKQPAEQPEQKHTAEYEDFPKEASNKPSKRCRQEKEKRRREQDNLCQHVSAGATAAMGSAVSDVLSGEDIDAQKASVNAAGGVTGSIAQKAAQNMSKSASFGAGMGAAATTAVISGLNGGSADEVAKSATEAGVTVGVAEMFREGVLASSNCATQANVAANIAMQGPSVLEDLSTGNPAQAIGRCGVAAHQGAVTMAACAAAGPAAPLVAIGLGFFYQPFYDAMDKSRK